MRHKRRERGRGEIASRGLYELPILAEMKLIPAWRMGLDLRGN